MTSVEYQELLETVIAKQEEIKAILANLPLDYVSKLQWKQLDDVVRQKIIILEEKLNLLKAKIINGNN